METECLDIWNNGIVNAMIIKERYDMQGGVRFETASYLAFKPAA
jgi:hypothetical protein